MNTYDGQLALVNRPQLDTYLFDLTEDKKGLDRPVATNWNAAFNQ